MDELRLTCNTHITMVYGSWLSITAIYKCVNYHELESLWLLTAYDESWSVRFVDAFDIFLLGNPPEMRKSRKGVLYGAPKIAKLRYKWLNYGLWSIYCNYDIYYIQITFMGFVNHFQLAGVIVLDFFGAGSQSVPGSCEFALWLKKQKSANRSFGVQTSGA